MALHANIVLHQEVRTPTDVVKVLPPASSVGYLGVGEPSPYGSGAGSGEAGSSCDAGPNGSGEEGGSCGAGRCVTPAVA